MTIPDEETIGKLSLLDEPAESKFKVMFTEVMVRSFDDETGLAETRPALHNFAVDIRGKRRGWWQIVRGHGRWAARWVPNP